MLVKLSECKNRILLSIKHEFVVEILAGRKKFEFRRRVPKDFSNVKSIVIYACAPVRAVLAEVEVVEVLVTDPYGLWLYTRGKAGIYWDDYVRYFDGCRLAYAFRLGEVTLFDSPKSLADFGVKRAPQNFVYLPKKADGGLC